jgi:uncharacterized protein (DUF58 family)
MNQLRWLSLGVLILALALRNELFFYLLYVLLGLQLVVWWWMRDTTKQLSWERRVQPNAFPNEAVEVELELHNRSLLPIPWLSIDESVPIGLRNPRFVREVFALGVNERRIVRYSLQSKRRGLYWIGPLVLKTGDVLGIRQWQQRIDAPIPLTIYPNILPLPELGLPASLPYGTLSSQQRLFADPARPNGVRPYQPSDGVRQIDWKSSAHANQPVVRRYQAAISLETLIVLDFSHPGYQVPMRYEVMERALTAAASVAADLIGRRQAVGLFTNGSDPLSQQPAQPIAMGSGRAHLIALLQLMGRLEAVEQGDILGQLAQSSVRLPWGSTVVLITSLRGPSLVEALLPLQRRGLNLVVIICEANPSDLSLLREYGVTAYGLWPDGRPQLVQPLY